jgi:branched-chain amino acid transport system permease protein
LLINQIFNGLTIGSIYALIALGYSQVYGILGFINFAHGDLFMLGAYVGFLLVSVFHVGLVPALILSMLIVGGIGVLVERVAYRPLRKAARLAPMISSIGVSITLQTAIVLLIGPQTERYPLEYQFPVLDLLGVKISALQIIILVVAIALMLGLELLVQKTRIGMAMRATAENYEATSLMGVSINKVISLTFLLGSSLGAAAGVLVAVYYNAFYPYIGSLFGIKAFIAAVLGGIGSVRGAVIGGFILGISEIFATAYLSSSWRDAVAFTLLIVILLARPTGILGMKTTVRA